MLQASLAPFTVPFSGLATGLMLTYWRSLGVITPPQLRLYKTYPVLVGDHFPDREAERLYTELSRCPCGTLVPGSRLTFKY